MKFTKENVEKVINDYFRQAGFESCGDLIAEIRNLDDTPEKVVVPKFVADFYEECENAALEFLITQLEATDSRSELGEWYRSCRGRHRNGRANAQEVIAKMKLYGYEVEKEPLYCVNINGQYLVKMIPERNVHKFVEEEKLCVWDTQAYQLTEAEIKKIDERYIPFMVPVDEVNKD